MGITVPTSGLLLALADPERRTALRRRLAAAGIVVSTPENGVEAQRQITSGAYALLILDTCMPGLDARTLVPGADSDVATIVLLNGARELTQDGEAPAGTTLFLPTDLPDASLLAIAATLLEQRQRLARARETAGQLRQVFEEAKENLQRVESEHNKSEQRLQALRQRFHRLIDANPAVIYATEAAGEHRCLFVSRRLKDQLGYAPKEMIDNNSFWLGHMHPEDRERVLAEFPSLLAAGGGCLRYRFRHIDGSYRWLRDDFAIVRDHQGRAQEIIGCWSDISAEKTARSRFETIFRVVPDGILLVDEKGDIQAANPGMAEMFGYDTPQMLVGRPLVGLISESHRGRYCAYADQYFCQPLGQVTAGGSQTFEGLRTDGSTLTFNVALVPFPGDADDLIQVLAMVHDVSEQRAREQRIEDLMRAYAMLSAINQAVVGLDDELDLMGATCRIAVEEGGYRLGWIGRLDAAARWLEPVASAGEIGYVQGIRVSAREDDPEGQGPAGLAIRSGEVVVFDDLQADPRFIPWREAARRHGLRAMITLPLVVEGQVIGALLLYTKRPQRFSGEELGLLAELAKDLSFGIERIGREARRRKAEAHVESLAYHDELTGEYNRVGFLQAVGEILADGTPQAMAVFDLARLREVNLSLGYGIGDALLRAVASQLSGSGDGYELGHLGASVFAVLLTGVQTEAAATRRLEKLLGPLESPMAVAGLQVAVQYHAGLALSPRDGRDAETLLRRADLAKEVAKLGPGIVHFRTEMEPDPGEQALLARLVQALDSHQFLLHFQPKMDLDNGRVVAVEALVRWQDPDVGLQPPGRFIPLLERTGLMPRLTPQLLVAAMAARARWLVRGLDIRIAVNITAADLTDPGLPDQVSDACTSVGIGADGLALELTETAVLQDTPVVMVNIEALHRLGVKLSIDDFGTGHASLSRLVKLPVSQIKIDQSFVTPMIRAPDCQMIVEATIILAMRLGLEVVAEGIEDVATLALLREMGCDKAQGYVISRPLPETELLTWLEGRQAGS